MRKPFGLALLASGLALISPAATAASPMGRAWEVKTLEGLLATEAARHKAMIAHDGATLDKLLADEEVYVHSMGFAQTKAEQMHDIAGGGSKYARIDSSEIQPRIYGDIGIIHAIMDLWVGTNPQSRKLRYTSVYIWRDMRWQLISFHCSEIKPMGPAGGPGLPPAAMPPAATPPAAARQ